MKKVLIFSLAYYPTFVGGAEVAIREITDRITDIEFHLITNRFDSRLPREERVGNVTVHRIGFSASNPSARDLVHLPLYLNKPLYQFLAAWEAIRLHKKIRFDAMWAMMAHSTGVPAAIVKMFRPEIGYVLNLQEGDPIDEIERKLLPLWPLFSQAFTRADIIQPLSSYLARWARARGFSGTVEIIPNAVDAKRFMQETPESEIAERRLRLGRKEREVWLVSTSRMVPKNALDDVIRALVLLPSSVHFVNFGFGPDEEKLLALADRHGVAARVHLLPHPGVPDLPRHLKACDIFIRPSRSEGFGVSFMEAMAAGLPIIATQEGGIADFLFDEKKNPEVPPTGWAVDKDSPEQIAAAVQDIIDQPEKVKEVVATAKKMVAEKYDWNIIARAMRERVFARLFDRKT